MSQLCRWYIIYWNKGAGVIGIGKLLFTFRLVCITPENFIIFSEFEEVLRWILDQGASVNFYMFHGGTNFGFMNGANEGLGATNENERLQYTPDTTSYGMA